MKNDSKVYDRKRYNNYDILRLFAVFGVIINHAGDIYQSDNNALFCFYIYMAFAWFAVPIFLMFTGMFEIDNLKNENAIEYYKKKFYKIGIPTIIFTIFYSVWEFFKGYRITGSLLLGCRRVASYIVRGWGGHPLWYLYCVAIIYLLIPLLVKLKREYHNNKLYHVFALLYCILAFWGYYFEENIITYSAPYVASFLGFVIFGNEVKIVCDKFKKNNFQGILILICGFAIMLLRNLLLAFGLSKEIHIFNVFSGHTSIVTPFFLFAYFLLFIGISKLNIKFEFKMVIKYSLYIYLFHKFSLEILIEQPFFRSLYDNHFLYVPFLTVGVFILSLFLSMIYLKAYSFFSIKINKRILNKELNSH